MAATLKVSKLFWGFVSAKGMKLMISGKKKSLKALAGTVIKLA